MIMTAIQIPIKSSLSPLRKRVDKNAWQKQEPGHDKANNQELPSCVIRKKLLGQCIGRSKTECTEEAGIDPGNGVRCHFKKPDLSARGEDEADFFTDITKNKT
jgi:hypothetical protein